MHACVCVMCVRVCASLRAHMRVCMCASALRQKSRGPMSKSVQHSSRIKGPLRGGVRRDKGWDGGWWAGEVKWCGVGWGGVGWRWVGWGGEGCSGVGRVEWNGLVVGMGWGRVWVWVGGMRVG